MKEQTRAVEIKRIKQECTEITSLWFCDKAISEARPGQYLMVWMPGVDEIPMSISAMNNNGVCRITVRAMGYATKVLTSMNPGEKIGIRGPYGNSYSLESENPLLVAGGTGMASLMPLVHDMKDNGITPVIMLGARSELHLLFVDELQQLLGENLIISTDDGSRGYCGYASRYAAKLIETKDYDTVYTCGPELMMVKVFDVAEKNMIPVQASLERYIKCAVGLCGSCAIGPYRVCKDGPIFSTAKLREVREEFGVFRMDSSGQKTQVDH
jgi:dihydroorotate dehydrogenase electron transfer subunit